MRGLLIAGLIGVLCAWGLAAERSTQRSQDRSSQSDPSATQDRTTQDRSSQPGQATTADRSSTQQRTISPGSAAGQAMMIHRTSELIGKSAKSTSGEDLGSIHDIVLSSDYQEVSYVALAQGGVLGIGSKLHAVPWEAIQVGPKGEVTLSINKNQLSQASAFDNNQWPARADYRLLSGGLMGGSSQSQQQTSTMGRPGASSQDSSRTRSGSATQDPNKPRSGDTIGGMMQGSDTTRSGSTAQRMTQDPNRARSGGMARGTTSDPNRFQSRDASRSPMARGSQDIGMGASNQAIQHRRVSHLTGLSVKNQQNEDIGDVEDFALDTSGGRVVYTIVSFGGFWGIGEKYAAVPVTVIQIQPRNNVALLNADRKTLESIAFSSNQFPNLSDRQYAQRVYDAFQTEPYWNVYGYVPGEDQQAASDKTWGAQGAFAKHFDVKNVKTIKGTVQSVGTFQPEGATGAVAGGLRLRIATDDGKNITVYAGPEWYAQQQNFSIKPGDQITITGSDTKIGWREVVVASGITKDGQTLKLRDEKTGEPLWKGQAAGSMSGPQRRGADQPSGQTRPGMTQPGAQPGGSSATGAPSSGSSSQAGGSGQQNRNQPRP